MASMKHVQLEAGFNDCPLTRFFEPLGPLTTKYWVRSLWESLNYCGVKMIVDHPTIPLPQTGDKVLSDFFIIHCKEQNGIIGKAAMALKLAGLQRCKNVRGFMFNGRHFERKWLAPIAEGATRPISLHFPTEILT